MTTKVIQGIVENKFYLSPISPVLKSVIIEFRAATDFVYTILKPKTKLFCDNQEIEQSMVQVTNNTIARTLANQDGIYTQELRTALYGQIVWLESMVRGAWENNESRFKARERFVTTEILFINKFPQNFMEAGLLEKYMAETNPQDLISSLNNLPGHPDRALFSS